MGNSDKNTTLDEVKSWVQEFCEDRSWDPYHQPKDLAIGLVTEASELLEIFRFVSEAKQVELMDSAEARQAMADELADSLFFILRFAQRNGFDLSECLKQKLVKTAKKYPKP